MSDIKTSALELIGNTPILELRRYTQKVGVTDAKIFAKLEYFNTAGSVKDRVALSMIEDAEEKGILKEGATIIEPTSGNTGIGLACVAAENDHVQQAVAHEPVAAMDAAHSLTGHQQVGNDLGESVTANLQATVLIVQRGVVQNGLLSHINSVV